MAENGHPELYRKHRPTTFKEIIGQEAAVSILTKMIKAGNVPHAILFAGGSGCGKTTLARIMATKLGCGDPDFTELNAADFRGIEMVRDIRRTMGLAPIAGTCRIWLIDEAAKLTSDAQNGLLKMLEDPPSHVYFFLATTEPGKLLRTVITRCAEVKVEALSPANMKTLITSIAEKEGKVVTEDVTDRIIEVAEGSPRKALVILHQVIEIDNEAEQLNAILRTDAKRQAVEIARALMDPRTKWVDIKGLVKDVEEEPETVRRIILGYATTVLVGGGKSAGRAFAIANEFRDNWYDCGKAGLAIACYAIVSMKG